MPQPSLTPQPLAGILRQHTHTLTACGRGIPQHARVGGPPYPLRWCGEKPCPPSQSTLPVWLRPQQREQALGGGGMLSASAMASQGGREGGAATLTWLAVWDAGPLPPTLATRGQQHTPASLPPLPHLCQPAHHHRHRDGGGREGQHTQQAEGRTLAQGAHAPCVACETAREREKQKRPRRWGREHGLDC